MKILCICLSSTIQRTLSFNDFKVESVNRSNSFVEDASGKAINTARVLNQLEKGSAEIFCPIGKENKKYFLSLCKKDNLKIHYVTIPGKTRSCWTLLSKNGDTTEVVADEAYTSFTSTMSSSIEKQILKKLKRLSPHFDAFILAGSTPKLFSQDLCSKISGIIKQQNKILLADFHGKSLLRTLDSSSPDFIKINEEEFINTFKDFPKLDFHPSSTESDDFLKNLLIEVQKKFNSVFIITRGTKPTLCFTQENSYEVPVQTSKPVNTTACGDSFNSGFLLTFLKSNKIEESLIAGNHVARLNAQSLRPGSIN